MSLCNQCGACCRVLTLQQSPEEVQATAALTGLLGIPSDTGFAAKHWHPLTRDEAMRRNAYYASRFPADAFLYACDQLAVDGRCMAYGERPLVCRGYPWYEQPTRDMELADQGCGYFYDVIMEFVVRRPEM